MQLTVRDILTATGGTLLSGSPQTVLTSVETDSRLLQAGGLFVPIPGAHVDPHQYIPQVFANGAAASLTQQLAGSVAEPHCLIAVPDTQAALQQFAAAYRSRFSLPLIGVTGSVGKTSAREMLALALSAEKNVMQTQGNSNSQVGLPLTMFRLESTHTAAVIEMGISQFGEMERLTTVARPDFAVITNIGIAHIAQLHTQRNILAEKLKITNAFHKGSVLFLNGDDSLLADLRHHTNFPLVYYGTQPFCDFSASHICTHGQATTFTAHTPQKTLPVTLPVLGTHNVNNALAALAVAHTLGLDLTKAAARMAHYKPPKMRQTLHHANGLTIIDDTYNASPDSVKSGLNVLCLLTGTGKKIAVLADMLELGQIAEQAHFQTGQAAATTGIDALVTVGTLAAEIAKGALQINPQLSVVQCQTNAEAIAALHTLLSPGDAILVKGSRGMQADEIVAALCAPHAT